MTTPITVTKKAFGNEVVTQFFLNEETGLPITTNEDGSIILGIPDKFFSPESTPKKDCRIAKLNYKKECNIVKVDRLIAKNEEINEEIEYLETGKLSKKAKEKQKQKLLAQLAALEE